MNATLKSPNISVAVKGLGNLNAAMLPAAAKGLAVGLEHARGVAMRRFLSGPRPEVLDVVTTRLRGSISTAVRIEGGQVRGTIGSNVTYAPFHEFGFKGSVKVKEHTRAVDHLDRVEKIKTDKKGRRSSQLYRFAKDGSVVGYKTTLAKLAAARGQMMEVGYQAIGEHQRTVNYAGKPFIRPAVLASTNVIAFEVRKQLALIKTA